MTDFDDSGTNEPEEEDTTLTPEPPEDSAELAPEFSARPGRGKPPPALRAGDPKSEDIKTNILALELYFISQGVPVRHWHAYNLVSLPKGEIHRGLRAAAIPPLALWPNMVRTLKLYVEMIDNLGIEPKEIRGYRPPDYNKAVGGSPGSTHQWFAALDIYPPTWDDRKKFAREAARIYKAHPGVGFGAYGKNPIDIHIDTGKGRRAWRDGPHFIKQV